MSGALSLLANMRAWPDLCRDTGLTMQASCFPLSAGPQALKQAVVALGNVNEAPQAAGQALSGRGMEN